jgi:hypothetical protein
MSVPGTRVALVAGAVIAAALSADALAAANAAPLVAGDIRTDPQKAQGLGWNTRTLAERLDAYRHDRTWRGDLLASL